VRRNWVGWRGGSSWAGFADAPESPKTNTIPTGPKKNVSKCLSTGEIRSMLTALEGLYYDDKLSQRSSYKYRLHVDKCSDHNHFAGLTAYKSM